MSFGLFGKTPRPSSKAKAVDAPEESAVTGSGSRSKAKSRSLSVEAMPPIIQEFRATYIYFRRQAEAMQASGGSRRYVPAASLDGISKSQSIEDRPAKNEWIAMYNKLQAANVGDLTPTAYVRMLFYALRGSSVTIPDVRQLASQSLQELVLESSKEFCRDLKERFVSTEQRFRSAVSGIAYGQNASLPVAMYYAIMDPRTGLSSLFCYCSLHAVLKGATEAERRTEEYLRLARLADQLVAEAADEYSLAPDTYDEVWGKVIPDGFRVTALQLTQKAVTSCNK
jgi:hypothetical protein